jgi:NAD(P)-dependent dehydrogenase (short-subunit alcohol dehydrogenase family)
MNVLITGGTGQIGMKLVESFLADGHFVVFTSTNEEKAQSLFNQLESRNLNFLICDFYIDGYIDVIKNWLISNSIEIDILINNARDRRNLNVTNHLVDQKDWISELKVSLIAPYQLSMLLKSTYKSTLKSIINISSIYGLVVPNPSLYSDYSNQSPLHYGVTKAGLNHLTKELAVRFAPITRVNTITYGGLTGRESLSFNHRYSSMCPLGRMMEDEDIAGAALFLSSDKSDYITGQNIIVDGGWSLW